MKEDLLHFAWRFKKFAYNNLCTVDDKKIEILNFGSYNTLAGPDFFNASLIIDGQRWAGNVEMHVKSSDWFAHGHEKDANYNNVILHVVWEHDVEVFTATNQQVPVLVLANYVDSALVTQYEQLVYYKYSFINCENAIGKIDSFIIESWLERLFIERLEQKSTLINAMLQATNNNWEAVLFKLLLKTFGGNINGESFLSIADSFSFSTFQKVNHDVALSESLLFGQASLLGSEVPSAYEEELLNNYKYLKAKFTLSNLSVLKPQFFKLRPYNFPTIRLSQLANLYAVNRQLFTLLMEAKTINEVKNIIKVNATTFWDNHYTFQKVAKTVTKKLSDSFIELVIINTIIPLRFCYYKYKGVHNTDSILTMAMAISPEKNTITNAFANLKVVSNSAMHSQAQIQLYKNYCSTNKCLQCAVGTKLVRSNK